MNLLRSQFALDNFRRADESPLFGGGNWSQTDNVFPHGLNYLVSHAVTYFEDDRHSQSLWLPTSFPSNQYSEYTIQACDATTYAGLMVRAQSTSIIAGYSCSINSAGVGSNVLFERWDNDVQTNLTGFINVPFNIGDTVGLAAIGSNIIFYVNGIPLQSVSDNTYPSGMVGFRLFHFGGGTPLNFTAISSWAAGLASNSSPTSGTILGSFNGANLAQAFTNPNSLDLIQVVNEGGTVVWSLSATGIASVNPSNATPDTILGRFSGSSFATAFPSPDKEVGQFDLLQVVKAGGAIVFRVDYTGASSVS